MKLLVKNGMIATESQVFQGDILIEDEKIKSIGTVLEEEDAEVIDATGRYVIPGGVWTYIRIWICSQESIVQWMIFMMERWQQPVEEQRRSWITWRSARRDAACGIRWKNIIVWQMGNQSLIMDFMG